MSAAVNRRAIALDVGEKTLGVAVSDPLGIAARGLELIHRTDLAEDIRRVTELVARWDAIAVVVGIPFRMSGIEGTMASRVREFVSRLEEALPVPVIPWDERLTTVQAEREMQAGQVRREKRREVVDQIAAALILQAWLEHERFLRGEDMSGGEP